MFARRCVHGRNRPQPFATVRNRPQPSVRTPYGRAYGKFCRSGPFWRFQTSGCFVSRWQAWHFVTFRRVLERVESRFAWQAQYFCHVFQKDVLQFSWQAQHFGTCPSSIFVQRSTLDVSCCVFFVNRIGMAASSGDKVQIPWQAWHFVTCAEIDGSLARNIDFEVANFQVLRKTLRKTSILKLQSVKMEKSRTKCSFWCSHVSRLESLVFPWLRRVYGGSCKRCQNWRKSRTKCSFWCSHVSRLESLVFPVASPCLWGKLQNLLPTEKSPEVSYEMIVLVLPRVSSRVSGFPVASPCLWGKPPKPLLFEGFQGSCPVVLHGRRGTL